MLARKNVEPQARLGLAIAKKSVRKAVHRNRIKRIIRESFRHHKAQIIDFDFVVMCRDKAGKASKQELALSLQGHWHKLITNE